MQGRSEHAPTVSVLPPNMALEYTLSFFKSKYVFEMRLYA